MSNKLTTHNLHYTDMIIDGTNLALPWEEKSLIDKMITFECEATNYNRIQAREFWQTLIDSNLCWHPELPKHYGRTALFRIATEVSKPPKNFTTSEHVYEKAIGTDTWDRPASHEDWGRPLRWKQMRRERMRIVKEAQRIFEDTGEYPAHDVGCCKVNK